MVATPASLSALSAPRRLLFPGRIPSRPRSAGSLVMQLNAHGLHARPTRNTTLINLAAHLPAAVLSDLVGMHPNTAVCWARLSRSDWSAYLDAST